MNHDRLYSTDLYTSVAVEGDVATITFTKYSIDRMEEMVALDLRQPGEKVRQSDPCGGVDVMKALIDIPAPVSGTIVAVNQQVIENPDLSKEDPFGEGWLLKVRMSNPAELAGLLSAAEFEARCGDE